jgi:hypothetical protein
MTERAYCAGGKTITRLASERKRLAFRHGREGNAIASAGDRFKRQRGACRGVLVCACLAFASRLQAQPIHQRQIAIALRAQ